MKIIRRMPYLPREEELTSITITDFTADSAKEFMQVMFQIESDPHLTDVFVYVTSYGGEILSLMSMIETTRASEKNIHFCAMGEADSCGAFLVVTGQEGKRWMAPNSYMLIHEIRDVLAGTASDFKKRTEHIQIMQNKLFQMAVKNSFLSVEGLKKRIKEHHGEWLVTAEEALHLKLIDRIGVPKIKANIVWELENE